MKKKIWKIMKVEKKSIANYDCLLKNFGNHVSHGIDDGFMRFYANFFIFLSLTGHPNFGNKFPSMSAQLY